MPKITDEDADSDIDETNNHSHSGIANSGSNQQVAEKDDTSYFFELLSTLRFSSAYFFFICFALSLIVGTIALTFSASYPVSIVQGGSGLAYFKTPYGYDQPNYWQETEWSFGIYRIVASVKTYETEDRRLTEFTEIDNYDANIPFEYDDDDRNGRRYLYASAGSDDYIADYDTHVYYYNECKNQNITVGNVTLPSSICQDCDDVSSLTGILVILTIVSAFLALVQAYVFEVYFDWKYGTRQVENTDDDGNGTGVWHTEDVLYPFYFNVKNPHRIPVVLSMLIIPLSNTICITWMLYLWGFNCLESIVEFDDGHPDGGHLYQTLIAAGVASVIASSSRILMTYYYFRGMGFKLYYTSKKTTNTSMFEL
jgi:hypothetical protein